MYLDGIDLEVPRLGPATYPSPLKNAVFTPDLERVLADSRVGADTFQSVGERPSFEAAGPRGRIYFDPTRLTAAIVSCGGLCPGINDVIRALVMQLWHRYGVRDILGIRFGFRGLMPGADPAPITLTPELVESMHQRGGSFLGSSRGPRSEELMVDELDRLGVGLLVVIGGDGTMRGAQTIAQEVDRRGLKLSIVGVPKTIDNDIPHVIRSFGFQTAVAAAAKAVESAHAEARGAFWGVGLVKLMGRHAGFIATHVCLARPEVNLVLIPEIPFQMEGPGGVLAWLETRLERRQHAVIVAAEGAAQDILIHRKGPPGLDASGNTRLHDVGAFLADTIGAHFRSKKKEVAVRLIDPSYTIRSAAATSDDSAYCHILAQHAIHAGMSGRSQVVVAEVSGRFVHLPMQLCITGRRQVDSSGELWQSVLDATGQTIGGSQPQPDITRGRTGRRTGKTKIIAPPT